MAAKSLLIAIVLMVASVCYASADSYDPYVSVSNLAFKITKVTTQYVHLSVKIDVLSQRPAGDVHVDVRGFDAQGFQVARVALMGFCDSGRSATLTLETGIEPRAYDQIKEWKIVSVRHFPPIQR